MLGVEWLKFQGSGSRLRVAENDTLCHVSTCEVLGYQ